jgi:dihydroorotase
LGISFGDLEWVSTGERLTEDTFNRYRIKGGWIVIHMMNSKLIESAVAAPGVIIASDGVPFVNGRAHPRGAGTYARVLGHYVRERHALPLMEALRKMTLLPAQRLEGFCPAMKRKGRLQVGSDADITVFDPDTVLDRATFADPAQGSAGIPFVLVGGEFVVRDGELLEDAMPGTPVRVAPE